ncbi:long-chain-fatty-acid--CoA ligase [Alteriqipengyuania lutimaris]|uniref:Long-chain fatty acid--CoA ligase n=1 Tax=Alteriqipengyuania lutimaris TaxID=1538146 RepID=A0A395LIZ7_9SPHN|nr:long-chain fatty acid--CoA ligase [Alteriqipengyuania lutimaris]MBB3034399.1 long-chain acyl-CoA synthetase [Alteriqipengyuania lutimaris]RDS76701.1 long-chain fatty acid--CoA ligase [Alteriqipengyuania lutimaris]
MDVSKLPYHHPRPWDSPIATTTMPALFGRAVEAHPDRTLVEFMGRKLSYQALHAEARRFAAGLQEAGIGRGDRIGLFLPNVPIYLSAYYGAMMAGATVVNFSPLYSVDELSHQVEDSGTRLLVTVDVVQLYDTAAAVLEKSSLQTLVVGELAGMLPTLKGLGLKLFKRSAVAKPAYGESIRKWADMLPRSEPQPLDIAPHEIALLQYTGGTTGRPKGAMLSHANLAANAQQVDAIDPFDRDDPDVIMGALPLFHVFANTCVLNRSIVRGATIAMVPRFDAGDVLKTLQRARCTGFPGVPTMFQALLDHPKAAQADFSQLRICISGGAPLADPLREKFERVSGVRLVEGYGLTESSGVVSTNPYVSQRKAGTIGQVIPQTRLLLLDKEDETKIAPEGEPGELAIHGPQIMQGYWNLPQADAEVFVEHDGRKWLRTGDVARIGPDGFVEIVDRIKDMISVGGFKVFPSQVEDVLQGHPAIRDVLVIGVPDDYHGEMPRAYATLQPDAKAPSAEALREWLNGRVGKHERVDEIVIRKELPVTMVGKLDRKALRKEVLG